MDDPRLGVEEEEEEEEGSLGVGGMLWGICSLWFGRSSLEEAWWKSQPVIIKLSGIPEF